jgi:choline/ethanolamine kinase
LSLSGKFRSSGSREKKEEEEMRDKAFSICREFLSGSWKKINSHDMVFKSITGGTSNILYYCSLPSTHTPLNGEPSQVLLRMYGQLHSEPAEGPNGTGSSQAVATVTDSVIFMMLSERNLGPKLYGIFPGGRLEEYIPVREFRLAPISRHHLVTLMSFPLFSFPSSGTSDDVSGAA